MDKFKPISNDFNGERRPLKIKLLPLSIIFIAVAIGFFGFYFFFNQKSVLPKQGLLHKISMPNNKASCREIKSPDIFGQVILCAPPAASQSAAVVVAVGGWGSTARQTEKVCQLFTAAGWPCLALDSANNSFGEEAVVENIKKAVDYLRASKNFSSQKIVFWGGSNGGRYDGGGGCGKRGGS